MAKNITPLSVGAPGFYGLNLSDSPIDMSPNFCLEANNCVIDKYGRIASRKGWTAANSTSADLGTANVECIGELVQNDGTSTVLCAGNGKLFKLASSTLTNLTYGGGGVAPTISANNWKFCQLNGIAMFWQRGFDPLIYDPAVSTTTYRRLSEKSGSAGTVYQCNEAISAYGRVWAADISTDKQTVVFSDLLTPHIWTGGTAGSLDLRQVWPSGGDEVVALAAHNEFLFIFGKWQILIYKGATDPATMELSDVIVGVGCIARDSMQNIGEDVIFLSDAGVQSLRRVIQEKSAPLFSVSKNIEDTLRAQVTNETAANIKSGYSATNHFYLLTLPTNQITYCFDTRTKLQDGAYRVTAWQGITSKSFYETNSRKFYLGKPGYVGEYAGYTDNSVGYLASYFSTWIDFGNPIAISILKKIYADVIGARNQSITFRWGFDFTPNQYQGLTQISADVAESTEYGISEYNEAYYNSQVGINRISVNCSGTGRVVQIGFTIPITGYAISIQKFDVFTKEGRI
jgi:hypothetical protein